MYPTRILDPKTDLIGTRVSNRTMIASGPERKLAPFVERIEQVKGIIVTGRDDGESPDEVGTATLLFADEAKPLLTLLPPINSPYMLGNQEETNGTS